MPNLLTHIKTNNEVATINSVHYIAGTGSTAGTWLGTDKSINEYYDGLTIAYKVPVAGASTTTLNITGSAGTALGAKTVYRNASSKITTHYAVGSVVLLVYTTDSSNTGSWQCVDYDSKNTYTNAKLGQGYGTCSTAAATAAKAVTLSDYTLTTGGVVAVKFTNAVPANATLNVNSKGAKNIYYRGAKIVAGVINAGDTATFIYDGTNYHLLSIDNAVATATQSTNGLMSSADKTKLDGLSFGMYGWDTEYEAPKIIELLSPDDLNANNFMGNALSFTMDGGATAASFAIQAAKVAKTGSYNDLSDKPTIPSAYSLPTASSSQKGGIKVGTGLSMSSETMSVAYGTSGSTACVGNDSRLSDSRTPTSHATNATTYGAGTTSNYGHVKIQNGDLHTKSHVDGVAAGLAHTHSLYFTTTQAEALDLRKQEKLESGTNIKTINGNSILGSGNISISSGSSYTLPTASSSTKGGIKVGTGLSMSSDTMSVSYGTTSTTAAVGNDTRFGKVNISKMEYRDTGNPTSDVKYYKFGFIDCSTPGDHDINSSITNSAITYISNWYSSNQGFVYGSSLQVKSFSVSPTGYDNIFWSSNTGTGFDTDVVISAGKVLKFNKINIPTASGGSTYGTGSSGKVLKSNGTTVYWGDDNNTTYTFNGAVSTIKDSNLTASRALVSNSSGKVAVSAVTSTELGYLDGVTSSIQTQLNGKLTQATADARYALKSEINSGTTSVQILTRAEYDALTTISSDVLYIVRG